MLGHQSSLLKYVVISKRSLVSTIDRERIKKSGWGLKKLPTELTFPSVKLFITYLFMVLRDPRDY